MKLETEFSIDRIVCYFLLLLVVLYYSQGVLPLGGIGQNPVMLIGIFGISVLYVIRMIWKNTLFSNQFLKIWFIFLLVNILYYVFTGDYAKYNIFKTVLLNFLPLFPFYYFAKKNILTRQILIGFFILLLPILILKFRSSIAELQTLKDTENVVSNAVYMFIGLLPFALLFKRKILSFGALMLLWFFMIQSSKRAAIVCGVLALGLFVYRDLYTSKAGAKLKSYLVAFVVFLGVTFSGYYFYQQNAYLMLRMQRMMAGYSSGRDVLIEKLLQVWYRADNIIVYLFGYGYNATQEFTYHVSHNDWVDMLASFGLLGLFLYVLLYRAFFLECKQKDWDKDKKVIFILFIGIALVTSTTSRWYWSSFGYMQMLILPFLIATRNKKL